MSDLDRQPPVKDKKKLWWLLLLPLLMPLPIIASNVIEEATGMTETKYLDSLNPEELGALEKEMRDQEQEIMAYMHKAYALTEEEIGKDHRTAFYMSQLFVRELVGPTKIIRFGTMKQAVFSDPTSTGMKVSKTGEASKGINVTAQIYQWGQKSYVPATMEATVSYQGDGWWKMERLNIPGKRGILRFGIGMEMPKKKIEFSSGMFFEYKGMPGEAVRQD